jgi:hypothetical protein
MAGLGVALSGRKAAPKVGLEWHVGPIGHAAIGAGARWRIRKITFGLGRNERTAFAGPRYTGGQTRWWLYRDGNRVCSGLISGTETPDRETAISFASWKQARRFAEAMDREIGK